MCGRFVKGARRLDLVMTKVKSTYEEVLEIVKSIGLFSYGNPNHYKNNVARKITSYIEKRDKLKEVLS